MDNDISRISKILGNLRSKTNFPYSGRKVQNDIDLPGIISRRRKENNQVRTNPQNQTLEKPEKPDIKVENYTYKTEAGKSMKGKLHYKADGSLQFVSGNNTFEFESEERLKKSMPSKTYTKAGKIVFEQTSYEYNNQDKVISITKEKNGAVVLEQKNNDKGQPLNVKNYSEDGKNLLSEIVYKDIDENHRSYTNYNKNHEIISTGQEVYENGKMKSREIFNKENKKIKELQFKDGKLESLRLFKNDKLIEETIYIPETGGIKSKVKYDENGNIIKQHEIEGAPDGKFDSAAQVSQGDCYLLATINSLRETEEGRAQLEKLIDISTDANGKKTYTITLPGAQIAADSLSKDKNIDPNKMYITGTYTFTEDEVNQLIQKSGSQYSLGDADVLLLEAAFEKYRQECKQTITENNIKSDTNVGGLFGTFNKANPLSGGLAHDSTFVLTGKPSDVYMNNDVPKNVGLDIAALRDGKIKVSGEKASGSEWISAGVSEINGPIKKNVTELDQMLDKIMKEQANGNDSLVVTAGFYVTLDGKSQGGHAFTIKKVTEDTVTLINPWNPDQDLVMSREDFVKTAKYCNYTDLNKNHQLVEKDSTKVTQKNKFDGMTRKTTKDKKLTPKNTGQKQPGKTVPPSIRDVLRKLQDK